MGIGGANINAGTRKFEHVTGQFVASGALDFATGQAVGTYTAHLCRADDDRGHDHD